MGSLYGRYALGSLGLMAIATVNGIVRETTYAKAMDDDAAGLVSLVPMATLFALYVNQLEKRWPIPRRRDAAGIGAMWTAIAAGFELGVGHFVDDKSWSELLGAYNLAKGRSGGLVLVWTLAVPSVVHAWRASRARAASGRSLPGTARGSRPAG